MPAIPRSIANGMYDSVVSTQYATPDWAACTRKVNATLHPDIFRRSNSPPILDLIHGVGIWNVPYRPLDTRAPLISNIRTLVLDGQMEAQTPFGGGATVAARLPTNSLLLTFPRSGHGTGFTSGPAMQAIVQFIDDPTRRPTSSLAPLRRNNFYVTPGPREAESLAASRAEQAEDPSLPLP